MVHADGSSRWTRWVNAAYRRRSVIKSIPSRSSSAKLWGRCDLDHLHQASELSPVNLERIRASIPGKSWRDWPPHLVNDCHSNQDRISWRNVYGRMGWHLPAPTITTRFYTYGCGRFGHPEQDRALSLREWALLQSFPAGYEFVPPETTRSKRDIARLIGNAVPPALAKAIGKAVVQSVCT